MHIMIFIEVKTVKKIFPYIMAGIFLLTACENQPAELVIEPQSKSFFAMDTYMTITAYGKNAESALNQAEDKIEELEKLWSVTNENSEIYAINNSTCNTDREQIFTEVLHEKRRQVDIIEKMLTNSVPRKNRGTLFFYASPFHPDSNSMFGKS